MKYYLDTEFHEFKKKPLFGKAIDTIELISIGIVQEDRNVVVKFPEGGGVADFGGREYYAICNEFDFKAAWNNEWLRDNVILPISYDLAHQDYSEKGHYMAKFNQVSTWVDFIKKGRNWEKTWVKRSKELFNKYGKSKSEIQDEILSFTGTCQDSGGLTDRNPEFYAYYADYDWVVFCWIFGRMIDLPNGFPKYCRDLKQIMDEKVSFLMDKQNRRLPRGTVYRTLNEAIYAFKGRKDYPAQVNEHNALDDAKWNRDLHKFLEAITD